MSFINDKTWKEAIGEYFLLLSVFLIMSVFLVIPGLVLYFSGSILKLSANRSILNKLVWIIAPVLILISLYVLLIALD